MPEDSDKVFINCPFDKGYQPIFEAIVFSVFDLGFSVRCSLESDDSGEVRITKIARIIEQCKFGVHDISEVKLDKVNRLPRFNMPLELGMFLGCKRFGGKIQARKICLILDTEQYRYQKYISDIAGQDIRAHGNKPEAAIVAVRNWLASASKRKLPGGAAIASRWKRFIVDLPELCIKARLDRKDLIFKDLTDLILAWLENNR